MAGPGRALTHRPGPFCWCRSTVSELLDIVQMFREDVAVPKSPEHEGSPRLITIGQIAEEHGVSRSSVHTYRRSATFPRPVPAEGSTRIQYRAEEVAAWFEANPPQQGKRTDLPRKQQGEPVSGYGNSGMTREDYEAREQLLDTAVLVEGRWPGEYSALCRDLRNLADTISEESAG